MKYKMIILQATGISEKEYDELVFERAYDYLDATIGTDEWGIKQLTQNKLFWAWWTRQWERRDRIFVLEFSLDKLQAKEIADIREMLRIEYLRVHDVTTLNIIPNRFVMESSFSEMIGELIDGGDR